MSKNIAFINGKGGCGKTTSIFHVSGVLSKEREKILVIDFDKQRNTTDTLLMNTDIPQKTIYDFMIGAATPAEVTQKALFQSRANANPKYYGVDCMVADVRLEDEKALRKIDSENFGKELAKFIEEQQYTWVLLDMPPSNKALNDICFSYIADYVIVPFSSDIYSVKGYSDLMDTVYKAREKNPSLNILGVYLARYMFNCAVDSYIKDQLEEFGDIFIDVQIPLASDIREGVMFGRPISYYKERAITKIVSESSYERLKEENLILEATKEKKKVLKQPEYRVKIVNPSILAYERLVEEIKNRINKIN